MPAPGISGGAETERSRGFRRGDAGLAKLRNRQYHRPPLSKAVGDGLYELRHVGKLNTRVLWSFVKDRRIVAVHAIRNKGQAIPDRDRETAVARMHDWRKREGK